MKTKDLTMSAVFLALGLVLPFLTGQIPTIGSMLLPMHYPVFLCGFVCGPFWGGIIGFLTPLLRSFLFGMPPIYPTAIAMAFELATYGIVSGILFSLLKKTIVNIYVSLIGSMLVGRIVWGISQFILLSINGKAFTFAAFLAGAFTNAFVGIIIQIILIPCILLALSKAKLLTIEK